MSRDKIQMSQRSRDRRVTEQRGRKGVGFLSHYFSPADQKISLKGTVSRDFFALVFFLNLFILVLLEMP